MTLSDTQQNEVVQDLKALRSLVEPLFHLLMDGRPEYYEGKYRPLDILLSVTTQVFDKVMNDDEKSEPLSDDQAKSMAQTVAGILATAMQTNQSALLAELRKLPQETIAELKASL